MKFTDTTAKELLAEVKCCDLDDLINTFSEDEREDKTDLEILFDEVGYLLDMYLENGTVFFENLKECKKILKETKHGKANLYIVGYGVKYKETDIQRAKVVVDEYNRLKKLHGKLAQMI